MPTLTPDQRNYYYLLEAERTGIHKPILAALYQVLSSPVLSDGEKGLGISPANRIPLQEVDSFPKQVQYAANTIRSLSNNLVAQGWKGADLWEAEKGRYSDRFIQAVADGYAPPASEPTAARLEASDAKALLQAYLKDIETDFSGEGLPQNLAYLDKALLTLVERVPEYYTGLPHQRDAALEVVRMWRQMDTEEAAISSLLSPGTVIGDNFEESQMDVPLKQFIQRISPNYSGYPYQREALLRLVHLWRQLESREVAIASLKNSTSPDTGIKIVDPALIAFIQRIPQHYQASGNQRNALTELVRIWRKLDSRASALASLGIDPLLLSGTTSDRTRLANLAAQMDRDLLDFVRRLPIEYKEFDHQREALIRLVQLWRNLATRDQAIRSLFDDLKRMNRARKDSPDAAPKPVPIAVAKRPDRWTLRNIQLSAPIVPDGNFTWAEATHGGTRMPPNQATLDAMVRIARLAQRARDRIGRPFIITSWYRPTAINRAVGGARYSRHIVGDAMDFLCEGLSGDQLYWSLDPWWPGGLGRYTSFPNLCHIDARSYRARWRN
jgi:hypothetical protein